MNLRVYQKEDAGEVLGWLENEREFRLWSANYYHEYPIEPTDINNLYRDCEQQANFYPFMLEEDGKKIGHFVLKRLPENPEVIQIGFVVVNNDLRGNGYGKKMLQEAVDYAKNQLGAKEIHIKVFTNNEKAFHCYESVGFHMEHIEKDYYHFENESWDRAEMVLNQ